MFSVAYIISKAKGVLAGVDIARLVFRGWKRFRAENYFNYSKDGTKVKPAGRNYASGRSSPAPFYKGRTALDFMQRLLPNCHIRRQNLFL